MTDRIEIHGLRVRTEIGVNDWERGREQDVLVDLVLHVAERAADAPDTLESTVDYAGLRDDIVAYCRTHRHGLLESLAERLAAIALERERVQAVDVTVHKPGALRFADSVAVAIRRPKPLP